MKGRRRSMFRGVNNGINQFNRAVQCNTHVVNETGEHLVNIDNLAGGGGIRYWGILHHPLELSRCSQEVLNCAACFVEQIQPVHALDKNRWNSQCFNPNNAVKSLGALYFCLHFKEFGIERKGQTAGFQFTISVLAFPLRFGQTVRLVELPPTDENGQKDSAHRTDSLYHCGILSPGPFGVRAPGQLGVRGYLVHKCCTRWPHVRGGKCLGDRRRHIQNQGREQNQQSSHAVNLTENRDGRQGAAGGAATPAQARRCWRGRAILEAA